MTAPAWYFPHVHQTFDHGLLTLACIWDRMARFIPLGMRPRDSKIAKRLQKEFDLFDSIETGEDAALTADVDAVFAQWLESGYERGDAQFAPLLGKLAIERTSAKTFRVFKVDRHPLLVEKLDALSLTMDFAAGWKGVSRLIQDLYLTILTQHYRERNAETQNMPLVGDDPRLARAAIHARTGFGAETLCRLHVEFPVPHPKAWRYEENVNWDALTAYRAASGQERGSYLQAITTAVGQIAKVDRLNAIEAEILEHSNPAVRAYKESVQCGKAHGVPFERAYLRASCIPPGLQGHIGDVSAPVNKGWVSYQLESLTVEPQSSTKAVDEKADTWTLQLETPLATPTGMEKVSNKVKNFFRRI